MKKTSAAELLPDVWSAFVATLVKRIVPTCTDTDVFDQLGIAGLYLMSEEWWDPSIIELHPRLPVSIIPALCNLRAAQLQRMSFIGAHIAYSWHKSDDASFFSCIVEGLRSHAIVGLFGISGSMAVLVVSVHDNVIVAQDASGKLVTIDVQRLRAPAGIECFVVTSCQAAHVDILENVRWMHALMRGMPTIAFDTPHHPLRDWQVWHIGIDAFAVAAFSAENAAPLAIVSDNVSRVVHAYIWRMQLLRHQLHRLLSDSSLSHVVQMLDYCDDALFFMRLIAQHYPQHVERRSLIVAEGALIAEACRDTRQALRAIVDMLSDELV